VETVEPEKDLIGGLETGKDLYEAIAIRFDGNLNEAQKTTSLFLLDLGIDGVKFPAESVSRGTTSDTARGFNYVVFDENAVTIDEKIQFLSTNDKVYGFYDGSTGEIYLTEEFLNSGALIHEHFHLFKPILKEQASKGNKDAKLLLSTLTKIVDESGAFNEAEFSARYDAANRTSLEWSENRQGKGDKKILERNQAVQQSAIDLKAGRITNEQHRQNVLENSPIEPITTFYKAASESEINKALASNLVGRVNEPVEEGKMVALRLDIPAYQRHNTWVVTVHGAKTNKSIDGLPISFCNVARITNVTFNSRADKALAIATGAGKDSFIRINGNWKNFEGNTLEEKGKEAEALVGEIKDNPEWVQVGTNPFRQSFFYDRANGIPVKTAEEVVQIGGLVYAKNVEYGNINDPEYTVKGLKDAAGNPVQFSAESEVYHGGDISMGIDGPLYTSWDEKQSQAYANGNEGGLYKFGINKLNIISEDEARSVLKEEGFTPAEGWILDELNLHEIIDTRFDTSIGEDELLRFAEVLKSRGIDAIKFTDTNILTLKEDISTLVVFNTEKLTDIKMSTTLSSEAYNPRPGESKKDYLDRMREEVEANLLGDNSIEYFQRIAEENNFTEAQTKTFLQRIKAFIGKFSKWIADQLEFKNITPEQAAAMTTKEALDRITTSMLRGDFGALDIKNGVDSLLDTTSELQPTPIAIEDYFSTNEKGEQVISLEKIKDRLPKAYDTLKKYLREPNLNEFRNIVAGEYTKTYKYKVGIANSIEALKELEKISTEIDKIKPLDFISKEEFLQETLAKGEYTTEQKEIMKTLILSLNTDRFPKYATDKNLKEAGIKRTTTDNFYIPDSNVISAGNPAAFVHEIGHFAFGTVLSPEDRIAFLEYVSNKFYGKGAPSLKESIAATSESITYMRDGKMYSYRTNVADNFDEYFAEQFSQWYLGEKVAPEGIRNMFQKVADYLNKVIEKLISKKYIDKELVPFFEKIVKDNTVQKEVTAPSEMFSIVGGITPTQGFSIPRVTAVEEALAEVEAADRHTNSVAFMNSVGFKLLIKTDIKKIDNC
jgi:hypothetical protein